nr:MAG TPA: hypothetical protein [Caudoviricetes sp.]
MKKILLFIIYKISKNKLKNILNKIYLSSIIILIECMFYNSEKGE